MHRDFLPTATLERLRQRSELLKQIRRFFEDRDFLEVETPILSHDTCVDRHLHPIKVDLNQVLGAHSDHRGRFGEPAELWLQTSPEFAMKRLLAAGAQAIYQISKVFRGGELGRRHNPEFTMLEWYRVGDNLETGMALLAELTQHLCGPREVTFVSYAELFRDLNVDPHRASIQELKWLARERGIQGASDLEHSEDRDFWLNLLLSQIIEPQLGVGSAFIVYDWPASQSALAQVKPGDPPLAERFELFVDGVEIANGYHELLDPQELRLRNRQQNRLRQSDGYEALPEESRLLKAMESGIPACAGVALGVDRLAMLLTGAAELREVIAFPFDRA